MALSAPSLTYTGGGGGSAAAATAAAALPYRGRVMGTVPMGATQSIARNSLLGLYGFTEGQSLFISENGTPIVSFEVESTSSVADLMDALNGAQSKAQISPQLDPLDLGGPLYMVFETLTLDSQNFYSFGSSPGASAVPELGIPYHVLAWRLSDPSSPYLFSLIEDLRARVAALEGA